MAAAGFEPEDYVSEPVVIWPENWPAWRLWGELAGQWRTNASGGVIALDYGVVFARLDRLNLDPLDWEDLFQDIRVMESAALAQIKANH